MPAIVIEDVALNYSASILGNNGFGLPPTVFAFPQPVASTVMNDTGGSGGGGDSSDYWVQHRLPYELSNVADSLPPPPPFWSIENYDNDENFGSPLPFDASETGLWNGRFVPPPPRPPFFDESILTDGVTTCDLCSWAKPTKSTFTFDATIEKASELGWPLTLIIVSVISAIIGAILMITIVRYKRKKTSNRNDSNGGGGGVQWWSRNKRGAYSQHSVRRNNIYTGNPSGDSIRGLHHINTYHLHHQQQHQQQQPHHHQQHHHNHHHRNNSNNHNNNNHMNNNNAVDGGVGDPCNWRNVTSFVVTS